MTTLRDIKKVIKNYQDDLQNATFTLLDHGQTEKKIKDRDEALHMYNAAMRACYEAADVIRNSNGFDHSLMPMITEESFVCNNIIASLSLSDKPEDIKRIEKIQKELYTYTNVSWMIEYLRGIDRSKFLKYVSDIVQKHRDEIASQREIFEKQKYNEIMNGILEDQKPSYVDDQIPVVNNTYIRSYIEALDDALQLKMGINKIQISNQGIEDFISQKENKGIMLDKKIYIKTFERAYFLSAVEIHELMTLAKEGKLPDEKGKSKTKKNQ